MPDAISPKLSRACSHDLAAGRTQVHHYQKEKRCLDQQHRIDKMARETVSALESTSSPGYRENASHADADENKDDVEVDEIE